MAVTSIWPIHGDICNVLVYVDNDEKTKAPPHYQASELQSLHDVMDYAIDSSKTEQQLYVSAINCDVSTARQEMIDTKLRFGKTGGRTAYHAYQSFKPGEVTPEQAHAIGTQLANKIWGDRFQVVVATHLDKDHIHTHFVLNSVSFIDGKKFRGNFKNYYGELRKVSDEICRDNALSVPKVGDNSRSGKHYAEWMAEKYGHETWRDLIRKDIDSVIAGAFTWTQFLTRIKARGYEVNTDGKHVKVRPQGKERFVRLHSLDDRYTPEAIKRRILEPKSEPDAQHISPLPEKRTYHRVYCPRPIRPVIKLRGLRALYFYYLYRLGKMPPKRQSKKSLPFLLREELRKLNAYVAQLQILNINKIDTLDQLNAHIAMLDRDIGQLAHERKQIRRQRSNEHDEGRTEPLPDLAAELSAKIKALRKERYYCLSIEDNSRRITERLVILSQQKPDTPKRTSEVRTNESRSPSR